MDGPRGLAKGVQEMARHWRLLVVEDDPGHAMLLARTLRRAGGREEILFFGDGEEVLTFLRGEPEPTRDLLLLDMRLPRLDGLSVLRELRADPLLSDMAVIVTSTTLDPAEEQTCHALGCRSFLEKPIRPDAFFEALRRIGFALLLDQPVE